MRNRLHNTMDRYSGIKNAKHHVQAKIDAFKERDRQAQKEYWQELNKMKKSIQPSFKLPEDAYKGKGDVQQEIMEKVEKAQRELQGKDEEYQNFLKAIDQRQQEKMEENLRARRADINAMRKKKIALAAEVEAKLGDQAASFKDKEKDYWKWLDIKKQEIATRPGPPVKAPGSKSVEELVAIKKAELNKDMAEKQKEYKAWLASVDKPKFELPSTTVNTPAMRETLIMENAKKGMEKMNAAATEYQAWVKNMEMEKHEKMMEKVREKLAADKELERKREEDFLALEEKMAEAKAEQDRVADEARQAILKMQKTVHAKPMLIEQAYDYGKVFKKSTTFGKTQ